jgi:hypothetical protein
MGSELKLCYKKDFKIPTIARRAHQNYFLREKKRLSKVYKRVIIRMKLIECG